MIFANTLVRYNTLTCHREAERPCLCCLQVSILLWTCRWLTYSMWGMGVDPDNSAIPYLTALGDLLGGSLLAAAFAIIDAAGEITD